MYRNILVPLDGSAFGERALPLAAALARATGARLVLVRAAGAGADPHAVEDARQYLAGLAGSLAESGVQTALAVPQAAAPAGILAQVAEQDAGLVVMCTHGRSGLGRWVYGSVAEAVVAHGRVPVLLVRPTGLLPILAPEPGQARLLVPLDGSPVAEAALPHAAALARAFGDSLHLLYVVIPPVLAYTGIAEAQAAVDVTADQAAAAEAERATQYLAATAETLRGEGLAVETSVRTGWPADTILEQARDGGARLIVMATHGRTGLRRLLLGSVALEVVHHSLWPVLLVRPPEPEHT